jgi:hypothetical protein
MVIKLEKIEGIMYGEFIDQYGQLCSIGESSSAMDDCIWLGVSLHRMHLTQEIVEALLPHLQRFVETGYLSSDEQG